jgi:SulP family sulfate permease
VYDTGFLVFASLVAGLMLLFAGFFRMGRIIERIPHSILVGFTIGIAIIIVFSQLGPALGLREKSGPAIIDQVSFAWRNRGEINFSALVMVILTMVFCRAFEKLSGYIPGPVPALAFGYFGARTFWSEKGLVLLSDQYGSFMSDLFALKAPSIPGYWDLTVLIDLFYYAFAFFIIASFESLSYGRAADRLAFNSGTPFSADKELRGLGMINIFSSLLNGFPQSANLGRTALNIRIKGRSPLTGIARAVFIILIALLTAPWLEKIPVACIAGILLYVASGMIKKREVNKIVQMNNYHVVLMCYTVVAVPLAGFMTGVLSALLLYIICSHFFESKKAPLRE